MTSKILGIDPGLRNTGWAILHCAAGGQISYVGSGSIKTSSQEDINDRLLFIFREVGALVQKFSPDSAAIENTYVNTNFATSLQLSQARVASILAVVDSGLKIAPYPATTVKKTVCGSGNADKAQVLKMLKLLIPNFNDTKDKDAADAVALAFCHSCHL